jgi:hypothetical protein
MSETVAKPAAQQDSGLAVSQGKYCIIENFDLIWHMN